MTVSKCDIASSVEKHWMETELVCVKENATGFLIHDVKNAV